MIEIKSSQIMAVEFLEEKDHEGKESGVGKLRVQFIRGQIYVYEKITRALYEGLLNAPSAGEYFHEQIKPKALIWYQE